MFGLIVLALIIFIILKIAGIVLDIVNIILPIILVFFVLYIVYLIYIQLYFKSKKFLEIKESIKENSIECNELNEHIRELKKAYINFHPVDYGTAVYTDTSRFNFNRSKFKNVSTSLNTYNCSLQVCKNASRQPFKYICKYFNIQTNEETLEQFEKILNDFSSAEDGKNILKQKEEDIIANIKVPKVIKEFSTNKLKEKLGFEPFEFDEIYFPAFEFKYVSAGGNSSLNTKIIFDIENLNKFIEYLSEKIKFKNSAKGQRALMTSNLREHIKQRDNYTCKNCNISTRDEPNLLLEIDHIKPISKGGLTTEDNLQTLCWKCNRTKSNKF